MPGSAMRAAAPLSLNAAMRWSVVKRTVDRLSPATILEIGCGQGAFGCRLAARAKYLGLEPDAASCSVARARLEPLGGEVRNTGWDDVRGEQQFELVCAFEVLEHLEDDLAVLQAWRDLVAPGGALLVSMPAWPGRFNAWDRRVGHLRRYAPEPTLRLLEAAGFVDASATIYGWPLGYALETARAKIAGRTMASHPTGDQLSNRERTAKSGRTLQPNEVLGTVVQVAVLPFIAAQRLQPRRGTGVVASARRADL
jgi:SAM-dependent methyltransferase